MISITPSLKHMAWSNQKIFHEISLLPKEIYDLRANAGEWPIGKILSHFISAAEWYCFLLTNRPWGEVPLITNKHDLSEMRSLLGELDNILVDASKGEDGIVTFIGDNGDGQKTSRSIVLSQAVTHTAEHKAQLATILCAHGFDLNLDNFDMWSFDSTNP